MWQNGHVAETVKMVWLQILIHVGKWIGRLNQNLNRISIIVFCSIENIMQAQLIIQRRK